MSISSTLANALTGLTAASRSAQIVSTNVANVMTDGYARREIELSPRSVGGAGAGVQVDGVTRVVDEAILRELRFASASMGSADVAAKFHQDVLGLVGTPDEPSSLFAQVAEFETALLEASSRPESDARLANVLTTAQSLAGKLNDVSDSVQQLRQDADASIAAEVHRLNDALVRIADLNEQILRAKAADRDFPSLQDHQQKLIDEISELVPIRKIPRENETVALYTLGGALLLDIEPAEFGFQSTNPITADMTLSSSALSGLTINDQPVPTSGRHGPIAGGVLSELFAVRDNLSVSVQDDLDEMARDLIVRFEDPGLDPTLSSGDPGLFTDGGAALNPLDIVGLASRVEINSVVDPSQGGQTWRLRDGLGAATPGPVGDATLLTAMLSVLEETRTPGGGSFTSTAKNVSNFAASITSIVGQSLQDESNRLSFETARFQGMEEAFLAQGVDTDQELQKLLLIEQAYAANARVIQTADELLQLLIGL